LYRKLHQHYPWYLELIPALIIAAGFLYTIVHYPLLPDTIPTGLSISGKVTGFEPKGLFHAFYLPGVSLVLYLVITWISYRFLARPEEAGENWGITAKQRKRVSRQYLEDFRTRSIRLMFGAAACLVGATVTTSVMMTRISLDLPVQGMLMLPWGFYAAALFFAFSYYFQGRRVRQTIRDTLGR